MNAQRKVHLLLVTTMLLGAATGAIAQDCAPIPSGMIAWWPFDEIAGTTAIDRAGAHPGAHANGPLPSPGFVSGALHLDGWDDFVAVADNDLWTLADRDFTIELWASFDTPGSGSIGHPGDIFLGVDEGPGTRRKWFFALGGGFLNFHVNGPGIGARFFPLVPFSPEVATWYHLAVRREEDTFTLFIDGVAAGSATESVTIPDPVAPLSLGQAEEIGFMDGLLDEVSLYDRALSDAEISSIFEAGREGKCVELEVRPASGGDTGTVSLHVSGPGFDGNAAVRLIRAGEPDIVAEAVRIEGSGTALNATFDLVGKTRGAWDVVVENPDGQSFLLPSGFTIEPGRAPELWAEVVGLHLIRPGRPQSFQIFYGNRGNVDAEGVLLWLAGVPSDAVFHPDFDLTSPSFGEGEEPIDFSDIPLLFESEGELVLPLYLPRVAPEFAGTLSFTLTISPTTEKVDLRTRIDRPFFRSPLDPDVTQCMVDIFMTVLQITPVVDCAITVVGALRELGQVQEGEIRRDNVHIWTWETLKVIRQCAEEVFPPAAIVDLAFDVTKAIWVLSGDSCKRTFFSSPRSGLSVTAVSSFDPNEKVGARGAGSGRFVSEADLIRYVVRFENLETASAPAQEVVIKDLLDRERFDPDTLDLGPITFGNRRVVPPPGRRVFTTMVDLRPENDLLVQVEASLRQDDGVLSWRFTSIDPRTGQLPTNPSAGFLPPNVHPPEGDGSVAFTVKLRPGLVTGTEIRNRASIVFDVNAPIETPEWLNTLDISPPQSRVVPLPPTLDTPEIPVKWEGTDEGAGIQNFTVFVAEDDGPFAVWQQETTETTATFVGREGISYSFYCVARDLVGNVEAAPDAPDAATRIVIDGDGDGVPDPQDVCPDSDLAATVVIDGCDSGVSNLLFDDGCSLSDLIDGCVVEASSHGEFVSCVARRTNALERDGWLTGRQKGALRRCAARAGLP